MLKQMKDKTKLQKGFTIIEVMIVLAIAGLILVVVLIAIPQLQRNQRNNQRQSVANRIVTEINNYAGNNNGNYPIANITSAATHFGTPATALGFFDRYLGCDSAPAPANATCSTNINDPQTGGPVGVTNGTVALTTTIVPSGGAPGTVAGSISYATGLVCNGESPVTASNRNFVFLMRLEGGAVYCLDNK
jgi:prepilin-type N-terminal cleavage/methylation domain-containing protein